MSQPDPPQDPESAREQQLAGQARVQRAERGLRVAKLGLVLLTAGIGVKRASQGDPRLLYAAGGLLVWLVFSEFVLRRRKPGA